MGAGVEPPAEGLLAEAHRRRKQQARTYQKQCALVLTPTLFFFFFLFLFLLSLSLFQSIRTQVNLQPALIYIGKFVDVFEHA